jgi:hypothetical protein
MSDTKSILAFGTKIAVSAFNDDPKLHAECVKLQEAGLITMRQTTMVLQGHYYVRVYDIKPVKP